MDSQNGVASARRPYRFYAQGMVPIGEGVFETLKVVDARPHALSRHHERLARSAGELGLEPPDLSQLAQAVEAHLKHNPHALGRMRITLAAGPSGPVLRIESAAVAATQPTVSLSLSRWRVNASSPLSGLKTTDYLDYTVAMRAAQASGFDEALLTNTAGEICEASTANVFYVLDGVIHTPPLSSGCLPGIAREMVLEACEAVEIAEQASALSEATEVFLTSSLREVQPVARIDERTYPTIGPKTAEVMAAWRRQLARSRD